MCAASDLVPVGRPQEFNEQAVAGALFAWFSPAFPTGSFAYSHGLETAVAESRVESEGALADWLEDVLCHGAGWSDAVLAAMAFKAADDAALLDICDLASALAPSKERWIETLNQGEAFLIAVRAGWPWAVSTALPSRIAHAVAAGAAGARLGAAAETLLIAYLTGFCSSLIGAGVRLGLCGQSGGLRSLARLGPLITQLATRAKHATEHDLGGCALAADIFSMRHEIQTTRVFMT